MGQHTPPPSNLTWTYVIIRLFILCLLFKENMKFSKVIGKIDPNLVEQAEERLSQIFLELATKFDNEHIGSGLGGDPLIFSLMYPVEHVCTLSMPTAATDGKRYYWNPKFVLKKSKIGLRLVAGHEAWHAIYMHPQRRGNRLPKLWNIAVDYIVNGTVMDDLKMRHKNPKDEFTKHLGKFMTLPQYCELLKDPFKQDIKGLEDVNVADAINAPSTALPSPSEDRELTPEEVAELERREKKEHFFFADPDIEEEMRRPERIYDMLYKMLPKCPECGRVGMYKKPDPNKKDKKDKGKGKKDKKDKGDQGDQDQQSQDGQGDQESQGQGQDQDGDGQQPGGQQPGGQQPGGSGCSHDGCGTCGDGMDIFGFGDTLDDHMDTEESEEKLAKRVADAMYTARKMAGHVPGALEDELGKLTAPKIRWQDVIRAKLVRVRAGNGRNDWNRFKTRPMFSGMMIPKRNCYAARFGCLLDTSGSMSRDDMAFGLSQLASLDERSEGTIVPADCSIYWDQATKIRKANQEELSKIKVVGRGGTMFCSFFDEYEKNIGECDFLIMITDGYLMDTDIANMRNPNIPVYWLITAGGSHFNAPFGKVYDLVNK